jgi:argininosuccinate synthase
MGKINDNFRDEVMMTLNEELTIIDNWREPEQRRKALLNFKEKQQVYRIERK